MFKKSNTAQSRQSNKRSINCRKLKRNSIRFHQKDFVFWDRLNRFFVEKCTSHEHIPQTEIQLKTAHWAEGHICLHRSSRLPPLFVRDSSCAAAGKAHLALPANRFWPKNAVSAILAPLQTVPTARPATAVLGLHAVPATAVAVARAALALAQNDIRFFANCTRPLANSPYRGARFSNHWRHSRPRNVRLRRLHIPNSGHRRPLLPLWADRGRPAYAFSPSPRPWI